MHGRQPDWRLAACCAVLAAVAGLASCTGSGTGSGTFTNDADGIIQVTNGTGGARTPGGRMA